MDINNRSLKDEHMSLNNYRDEVKELLIKIGSDNGNNQQKNLNK